MFVRTVDVKCLGVDFKIAALSVDEVDSYMEAMRAFSAVEPKDDKWRKDFEAMQKEKVIVASLKKADPAWTGNLGEFDPALIASLSIRIRAASGMPITEDELAQADTGLLVMKRADLEAVGETKPAT